MTSKKSTEEIKLIIKELQDLANKSAEAQIKFRDKKNFYDGLIRDQFKKEFEDCFTKNKCYVLQSFCEDPNDKRKIILVLYFYGVYGENMGYDYCKIYEDWTWVDQSPIDIGQLKNLIKDFQEKYDCLIEVAFTHKKTPENIEKIESVDDLQIIYGEKVELIESGEIKYRGWDISNPWMLVKIDGVFVIFYADDAHSSNYNDIVKPKDLNGLNEFINYIRNEEQDNFFYNECEKIIKDNWLENKNKDFSYLFDYPCFATKNI